MFVLLRQLQGVRHSAALKRSAGSCAIRHVDAGSCNGCEHELSAVSGPHYDLGRFGLSIVASPRHADVLLITGTVTANMREALIRAYDAMPEPRLVAALGNCALGVGVLGTEGLCGGGVAAVIPVDIHVPGCPPSPQEIANQLLEGLERVRSARVR